MNGYIAFSQLQPRALAWIHRWHQWEERRQTVMRYKVLYNGALPSAVKPKSFIVPTFRKLAGRIVTTKKTKIG